jgi:hypothetical protein
MLRLGDQYRGMFWSISVYNAQVYFEPNILNSYSLDSETEKNSQTAPPTFS